MSLVAYASRGRGPQRSLSPSPALALTGTSDFANSHGIGGVLTACRSAVSPCAVRATLSVGKTVIARTGNEIVGAGDLGYVIFSLTGTGRSLLAHASGNQLGVQASLTAGRQTATGHLALVGFS
jgi:hypothetical protein